MTHLCSVICVSYNHARFAAASLKSIFDQSYGNVEIIIVDDGSTDKTVEIIKETLRDSPFPAQLIEQENTGNVPANINRGISESSGEYLAFLSLDDLLLPGCIASQAEDLDRDPSIVFAADSGYQTIGPEGDVLEDNLHMPVAEYDSSTPIGLLDAEFNEIGAFFIQGQLFRKDAILAVDRFGEQFTGDDIIIRTRLFRYLEQNPEKSFHVGSDKVLAYRMHDSNLHRSTFRQIKTAIEWKEAYFPDRPYPQLFHEWLDHFISSCIGSGRMVELKEARSFHPIIDKRYLDYAKTWKARRRYLKSRLKAFFRRSG